MNLNNKKVLVAGLGISGKGAVDLLIGLGADIFLYDSNKEAGTSFFEDDSKIFLGEFKKEILANIDYMVLSPGISIYSECSKLATQSGVKVIGELELAYVASKGKIAAITGTNGKTTTTALVGEILESYFKDVYVVGNIGKSFASIAANTKEDSVIVVEVSSFQLETIDEFRPHVSAILNLTPDHLDRHGDMENYLETKLNIAKNQTSKQSCIVNYDDVLLRKAAERLNCNVMFFSCSEKITDGMYLDGENIIYNNDGEDVVFCNVKDLKILGRHNYENVMAGLGVTLKMGVPLEVIRKAVLRFNAIEHRIEYVAEKSGVVYYNDSKGTNPDASKKAVEAMERPTVLIAGGYDKAADFDEWAQSFGSKIKCLVLIGATKHKIEESVRKTGFKNIIIVNTFKEAFDEAVKNSISGDAVLLSPACASWGMFKNFEERGNIFKEYVNQL